MWGAQLSGSLYSGELGSFGGMGNRFKAEIYPLRFCCFAAVKT